MSVENVGSIEYSARLETSKLRMDAANADAIVAGTGDKVEKTGQSSFGAFGKWAKIGLLAAGAATVALGVSAFKTGIDYNTLQQTSRAALKTILGSTEAASKQMDKLNEFVRTSPFSKDIFIKAQQQLLGFGVAAKDVIPALDAIQNAVAAVGGSSADIEAITSVLAKVKAEGRLGGEALLQLAGYGIDAATIIGSQMGKSGQEIRDMAGKPGGIPVEKIWDPLVTGLDTKFGGAADNVKNTWAGTADRISAAFRDLGSKIAAPFVDPNGGGAAINWGNKFADFLRAVPTIISTTWSNIGTFLQPFIQKLQEMYNWFQVYILPILQDVATFVLGQLRDAWNSIRQSFNEIVAALAPYISKTQLLKAVLIALLVPFALAVAAIVLFVGFIAIVVVAIARLIQFVTKVIAVYFQFSAAVVKAISTFIGAVNNGVSKAIDAFVKLVGSVSSAIGKFASAVGDGVGKAVGFFNDIGGKILRAIGGAGNLLYNVGRDIVGGLIKGIQDMIGTVQNVAGDIGKSVQDKFKSVMGISSPSKVFAQYGKYIAEGLSIGIDKNSGLASNSVSNLVGGVNIPSLSTTASIGSLDSLDSSTYPRNSSGTTVSINMQGIMTRSRSDERDIAKSLVQRINEELSAKGAALIGGGLI